MTGYATPEGMEELEFSPATLKPTLLRLIRWMRLVMQRRAGRQRFGASVLVPLWMKYAIDALYDASQAGVKIELFYPGHLLPAP